MRTFSFDLSLEPVDKIAARIVAKSANNHTFRDVSQAGIYQHQFRERIAEVLAKKNLKNMPHYVADYTGRTFGRITIAAYSHSVLSQNRKKGWKHYWVVRCTCGEYEMRMHVTLNKQSRGVVGEDMCEYCKRTQYLQHKASQPPLA